MTDSVEAAEGCDCGKDCEKLREETDLLRSWLENHLKAHQWEEEKKTVWTWRCAKPGCIRTVTNLGPIRAGQTLKCAVHGTGPLEQIFPPVEGVAPVTPAVSEPDALAGAVVPLERPKTGRQMPEPGAVRHRI